MKKPIKVILVILGVVVLLIVAGVIFFSSVNRDLEALADIPMKDVDLSSVSDGTYEGDYSSFPVSVTVEVTVRDHRIADINLLKHVNGQGQTAESITETVIREQSLEVDLVSGATYSSKVILLAVEDALQDAVNNSGS